MAILYKMVRDGLHDAVRVLEKRKSRELCR